MNEPPIARRASVSCGLGPMIADGVLQVPLAEDVPDESGGDDLDGSTGSEGPADVGGGGECACGEGTDDDDPAGEDPCGHVDSAKEMVGGEALLHAGGDGSLQSCGQTVEEPKGDEKCCGVDGGRRGERGSLDQDCSGEGSSRPHRRGPRGQRGPHQDSGFELVGVEPEIGRKFGRWLDVVVMQRMLG